jgi:dienelactone hydrolase
VDKGCAGPAFSRSRVEFDSRGERCAADLYLPAGQPNPPVVVMAHGFGALRSFRLPAYAERFATAGVAVLAFDYRSFGDSTGQPRQLVDPWRHLQDWRAAIAFVRKLPPVDGSRLALCGSSYSGGHAIVLAGADPSIAAIVAQVPYVDSITTMAKLGPMYVLRALPHGLADAVRGLLRLSPHYVKLVARPEEFGVMNTPESWPGMMALVPEGADWENKCCGRILLTFPIYRPIAYASRVKCPALIMLADQDSLIAPRAVERAARAMAKAELVRYPGAHFDIYQGEVFEDAVARQTAFLRRHLLG